VAISNPQASILHSSPDNAGIRVGSLRAVAQSTDSAPSRSKKTSHPEGKRVGGQDITPRREESYYVNIAHMTCKHIAG